MADYDVSTVQVDPSALKQSWKKMSNHDPVGLTPFSKALNSAANFASLFGPTVDVALSGSPKASGIFNGVLSGFMSGAGATPYANWSLPGSAPTLGGTMVGGGYGFKGLSDMPSMAPGYPGAGVGVSAGAGAGFGAPLSNASMLGGAGSDAMNLESNVASMVNQNLFFLALTTKINNVNQITQAMASIQKEKHEAVMSVIRKIGN